MNDKLTEAMGLLTKAAQSIGLEAVRLWPQLVGITFVRSVFFVVLALVLIAFSAVLVVKLWRVQLAQATQPGGFDHSDWGPMPTFAMVAPIVVAVFCLISLGDNLPGVFYPEAKTVLDLVTKR